MTIKIAHIADTHLGYKQYGLTEREEDFYNSFLNIIDDIIDKDVDYVLHAGDLFETAKPPINALLVAQQGFMKLLENDIPVYVISGNHDILQRRKTAVPQQLFENDNFHILSKGNMTAVLGDNIFLGGLQYISKAYEEGIKSLLKDITKESEGYKWKILMLHGAVSKYFDLLSEFELSTIPEGYDYYAMGHLHKRIMDDFKGGKLSYPGSTEIKSKDEIHDYKKQKKGYNLITITDEELNVEYINMPLEREFIIKTIDYPKLDESLDKLRENIQTHIGSNHKKPVVYLTIQNGDFDRTDVATIIYDKLEDITLTLKITYEPTADNIQLPDNIDENNITPEYMIQERLTEKFSNEDIATLGMELYKNLSSRNIPEARTITDKYYDKFYNNNK